MKTWISVLKKFRMSGNTESSFLCDDICKYHQAAGHPFGKSDPLQFPEDSIISYDCACTTLFPFISYQTSVDICT